MGPLSVVIAVLVTAVQSEKPTENWRSDPTFGLTKPVDLKIRRREVTQKQVTDFKGFVEDKLSQQSQALEYLLQSVDKLNDKLQKAVDLVDKKTQNINVDPRVVETDGNIQLSNARRRLNPEGVTDPTYVDPITKFTKNMTRFTTLTKNLFLKELLSDNDPPPLIESSPIFDK